MSPINFDIGIGIGLGQEGSPSDPLPIQLGVLGWYRADAGISTSAGKVTGALDQSGNGNDLTQPTGAKQFTYTADFGDGAPVIESAGTAWLYGAASSVPIDPNQDYTVITLLRSHADGSFAWSIRPGLFIARAILGLLSIAWASRPALGELAPRFQWAEVVAAGRLTATSDGSAAVRATDVALICVGTP